MTASSSRGLPRETRYNGQMKMMGKRLLVHRVTHQVDTRDISQVDGNDDDDDDVRTRKTILLLVQFFNVAMCCRGVGRTTLPGLHPQPQLRRQSDLSYLGRKIIWEANMFTIIVFGMGWILGV